MAFSVSPNIPSRARLSELLSLFLKEKNEKLTKRTFYAGTCGEWKYGAGKNSAKGKFTLCHFKNEAVTVAGEREYYKTKSKDVSNEGVETCKIGLDLGEVGSNHD